MGRRSVLTIALILIAYFSGYAWARSAGLFRDSTDFKSAIRSDSYRIMPIGGLSVIIPPWRAMPAEVRANREQRLASQKRISRILWPFYSWLASAEETCRRTVP